ncbi:MAG: hypothetical protein H7122_19050 [Chitinophagaceae bacterium]|nr:hypothetical protein [Chitinophagaceae bacterium]
MKRFIIILALSGIFSPCVTAQVDTIFRIQKTYPGDVIDFSVDNLGNIFILYQNGQLKKLNPDGDSLAVFNDIRRYGKLFSIDVTNPLKILLYYKDFSTVVILDRLLNNRATIDLRKLNLFQVKAISQSYDNNIWVFDEFESKLKRISDDGKLLDQFTDFRVLFDSVPSPQYIIDQNKQLYLYDSLKGIFIFDYYGAFKGRIPFTGWTDFSVINNLLFGRNKQYLFRYEPGTFNLQRYPIPFSMINSRKILITPAKIYLLRDNKLEVYHFL